MYADVSLLGSFGEDGGTENVEDDGENDCAEGDDDGVEGEVDGEENDGDDVTYEFSVTCEGDGVDGDDCKMKKMMDVKMRVIVVQMKMMMTRKMVVKM